MYSQKRLSLCLLSAAMLIGCNGSADQGAWGGPRTQMPRPVDRIQHITVFTSLSAINMDDDPAPDGVGVELFFHQVERPQTVLVLGQVDILMFDGQVSQANVHRNEPLVTWSFSGEMLQQFLMQRMGQVGYGMNLRWGRNVPRSESVTVVVRYTPQDGPVIWSSASAIPVGG